MATVTTSLAEVLASLTVELHSLQSRLDKLEALYSLPAKPAAPSPSAHSADAKGKPRKGQLAAPTSTPSTITPTSLPDISSLHTKAAFEKTVITLSIPDAQTGHVVGRAGTGLKQIHDISNAKVVVSPPSGTTMRSVTIRGTAREVGDAISAIGKRLARRRIRSPKQKQKKKGEVPVMPVAPLIPSSPVQQKSTWQTTQVPTADHVTPTPVVHLPRPASSSQSLPTPQSSPMSVSGSPLQTLPGSPMEVDVLGRKHIVSSTDSAARSCPIQPRRGLQTARCSGRGGSPPARRGGVSSTMNGDDMLQKLIQSMF